MGRGEARIDHLRQADSEGALEIIESIAGAREHYHLAVNLPNRGYITNLPDGAMVEVPGLVSGAGVQGVGRGRPARGHRRAVPPGDHRGPAVRGRGGARRPPGGAAVPAAGPGDQRHGRGARRSWTTIWWPTGSTCRSSGRRVAAAGAHSHAPLRRLTLVPRPGAHGALPRAGIAPPLRGWAQCARAGPSASLRLRVRYRGRPQGRPSAASCVLSAPPRRAVPRSVHKGPFLATDISAPRSSSTDLLCVSAPLREPRAPPTRPRWPGRASARCPCPAAPATAARPR